MDWAQRLLRGERIPQIDNENMVEEALLGARARKTKHTEKRKMGEPIKQSVLYTFFLLLVLIHSVNIN